MNCTTARSYSGNSTHELNRVHLSSDLELITSNRLYNRPCTSRMIMNQWCLHHMWEYPSKNYAEEWLCFLSIRCIHNHTWYNCVCIHCGTTIWNNYTYYCCCWLLITYVTVCSSMTSIAALENGCWNMLLMLLGNCKVLLLDGLGCLVYPVIQPSAVHQSPVPPNLFWTSL